MVPFIGVDVGHRSENGVPSTATAFKLGMDYSPPGGT